MQMDKQDYVKKALLDTQERVRDYVNYSAQIEDKKLQKCFKEFAEVEGQHARELQKFLSDMK